MISISPLQKEDVPEISGWFELDPDFPGDFSPFSWSVSEESFISGVQNTTVNKNSTIKFYRVSQDSRMVGLLLSIKPENFNFYEIGYYILPGDRGKGFASDGVRQLTEILFKSEKILRIEAGTSSLNLPSQRLLERLGFEREAVRRNTLFRKGRWEDSCLYALIKSQR